MIPSVCYADIKKPVLIIEKTIKGLFHCCHLSSATGKLFVADGVVIGFERSQGFHVLWPFFYSTLRAITPPVAM